MSLFTFSKNTTTNKNAQFHISKRITKLYKKDTKILLKLKNCDNCNEELRKLWAKDIPKEARRSILECDNVIPCIKHKKLNLKHFMILKEIRELRNLINKNENN